GQWRQMGRYEFVRTIGYGGMSSVSLVYDSLLLKEVAFKELRAEFAHDACCRARLRREAEVTSQLDHPGVIPVYDVGAFPDDNRPFYTMRLVNGMTLEEAASQLRLGGQPDFSGPHGGGFGWGCGRDASADWAALTGLLRRLLTACQTAAYAH